jgi:hypothetical protein
LNENTKAIEELKSETRDGFNQVNGRIDKVYDDGFDAFNKFQEYNRKQFEIIIDYGNQDKAMLKRILEISATEQARTIENNIIGQSVTHSIAHQSEQHKLYQKINN